MLPAPETDESLTRGFCVLSRASILGRLYLILRNRLLRVKGVAADNLIVPFWVRWTVVSRGKRLHTGWDRRPSPIFLSQEGSCTHAKGFSWSLTFRQIAHVIFGVINF